MKSRLIILIFCFVLFFVFIKFKNDPIEEINLNNIFKSPSSTFVLYDLKQKKYLIHNEKQSKIRVVPCSTFKIINSLIALESGIINNKEDKVIWSKTTRYPFEKFDKYPFESWNKDQTMVSAIENSVIWFYQELAEKIGTIKMQEYLNKINYGNKDISSGIDRFWLGDSLKISAFEQVNFLTDFYNNNLPFSDKTIKTVKNILILDKYDNYTLSGKTGSKFKVIDSSLKFSSGWFVGYLEKDDDVYIFATNIYGEGISSKVAKQKTYEALRYLKYLPKK